MKTTVNLIATMAMSSVLKNKLEELIEKQLVGFIFYCEKNLLNHPIITIFFYDSVDLDQIRKKKWIIKGIQQYQVNLYCASIKDFYQSDSFQNLVYSTLNCQRDNLVYGSLAESELLYNTYLSSQEENSFDKISTKWFKKHYKRHIKFFKIFKKRTKSQCDRSRVCFAGIKTSHPRH